MRADAAAAERCAEIRSEARSWRAAGILDDAGLSTVCTLHPDDRVRVGPVFRVLLFLFAGFCISCAYSFVMFFTHGMPEFMALLFGVGCVWLTEYQINVKKRAEGGTEAATSWMAVIFLAVAGVWLMRLGLDRRPSQILTPSLIWIAVLFFLAVWRWGFWLYGAFAASFAYAVLLRFPATRALWIAIPLLTAVPLWISSRSPALAPSHRKAALAALAVGLAALYLAVHIGSYDTRVIEGFFSSGPRTLGVAHRSLDVFRLMRICATAAVPAVLLALGVYLHDRLLLILGAIAVTSSVITLRFYVHIAPLWVVLTASGVALTAAVLALLRYLGGGGGREMGGITADRIFDSTQRGRALEMVAVVAGMTPAGPVPGASAEPKGGGGEFGGGGASGSF